jgi:glyoxylate carboligase
MWSHTFWVAVTERSIKTIAQTAAALLVGNGVGLLNADWVSVLSVAGMAGVVSVLTSIGSATVGNDGPSLAGEDLEQ